MPHGFLILSLLLPIIFGLQYQHVMATQNSSGYGQTNSDIEFTVNGTTVAIPSPENTAKLTVLIKEKNPPFWPFVTYLENYPVGFDIIMKNPTSREHIVEVRGQLSNPNPRDASIANNQPSTFKNSTVILTPFGTNKTEFWTSQLRPGGYVFNVSALEIYNKTRLPGGGSIETYSASGQDGLPFVVYSEDSRNNLYIALGTIGAATAAFVAVIFETVRGRTTIQEMKRQSSTSQTQVNLMREQLNLERRKKHHEKLIDDSMRHWRYTPRSSGEMIDATLGTGPPIGVLPRYLTQAKEHLEGYPAIWQLYRDAPGLVKRKEELKAELEDVRKTIDSELIKVLPKMAEEMPLDVKYISQIYGEKIFTWFGNRFDNLMCVFRMPTRGDGDELIIDDRVFRKFIGDAILPALNSVLSNTDLYRRFERARKELKEKDSMIESNRVNFESLLRNEVIDKVTVSGYEVMEGKCHQCPTPI